MKKNIGLSALLVLLLTLTYFFQEKRGEKKYEAALTEGKLITEEIQRLKLPRLAEAEKKNGQWWIGKTLLSHNHFKMIEKGIAQITSMKSLEGDPTTFFKDALAFEVNGEPWLIGEMSLDKSGFYVSKAGKISLAYVDAGSTSVSTDESELEKAKLDELKGQLSKGLEDLKEVQLFRFYPNLPMDSIKVHADGALAYELDLINDKTIPAPIPGISVHQGLKEKFTSVITQINIKDEVPYSEKLKFKKMASMVFNDGVEEVSWEVWLKSKSSADALILDNKNQRAFLMVGGSLRSFFIQVQDYWDKKVIPSNLFKPFQRLPISFAQGTKQALVTIIDREPLGFESKDVKVKPGNMQDLLQLIFNLGPKDQADRVSQFSKSDKLQFFSSNPLKIELMGQELLCVRKKNELILVNLTQGFKAHFINPFENLRCQFEDMLE